MVVVRSQVHSVSFDAERNKKDYKFQREAKRKACGEMMLLNTLEMSELPELTPHMVVNPQKETLL